MAALRSLTSGRGTGPPLRRRFTLSLLLVVAAEIIGLLAIAYLISHAF